MPGNSLGLAYSLFSRHPARFPSASESDKRNDSEEERERQDADQPTPRHCRYCRVGRFVLIAETPRPTVAQLMQMEPAAESMEVEEDLALSARL